MKTTTANTTTEFTVYKLMDSRKWTGRYVLERDGVRLGVFRSAQELRDHINTVRRQMRLKWRDVGISYAFGKRRG